MDNSPMVRRLSAVWFADIVGYTALSNIDEEAAIGLVGMLQAISRHIVEQEYGGRIVKYIGDAVLAEFVSTDSAVRSAIAVQERYIAAAEASGRPSMLRIGVHLGEVIKTHDGDIYGDGVNTASRLQGQAAPGKVLISEDVWRQLRMRTEFHFQSLGEVELKGITARVAVFDVLFGGEAALATAKATAKANTPKKIFTPAKAPEPRSASATQDTGPLVVQAQATRPAPVSSPLPYPAAAASAAPAPQPPSSRKAVVWGALAVLLVGGGAGGMYMMMSSKDASTAGAAEPTSAERLETDAAPAGQADPSSAASADAGGADAPVPTPTQPQSGAASGGGSATVATTPQTRPSEPAAGRAQPAQTSTSNLPSGSSAGASVGGGASAPAGSGSSAAASPSGGSAASAPPSSQTADPPRSEAATQPPASSAPPQRVADPTVERDLAISQAVATLTEFARAVQERSHAELSGPYRLRTADMAPIEQVYERAASGLRVSVLNARVRRIDGAGAEIDFLLMLEYVDRQGASQSLPLPYRAFVARETSGWRITTVQALVG